jgi:hypothetical protein
MYFSFYTIVTIIAIVLLVLALAIIGITLSRNTRTNTYPDYQYLCPDLWQIQKDNQICLPPRFYNNPNIEPINPSSKTQVFPNINSIKHDGVTLTNDNKKINKLNISDEKWTSVCDKAGWAKRNNILWDGVANNSECV